jgi:trk system potassium uptake protein TrkH
VGFLDALFTSTSAVCVTGLVVVDTAKDFTLFGQIVIMLLIQAGGLGVMTFAALLFQVLGRRLSLTSQAALHDSLFQRGIATEFRHFFGQVVRIVAVIEAMGATVIFLSLLPTTPVIKAAYSGVFHAVSAFCNAGFSIYSGNLVEIRGNPVALSAIMALIVLGGLGHLVLREIWEMIKGSAAHLGGGGGARRLHPLSYHSRVVLVTSGILIVAGMLGLVLFGLGSGERTIVTKLWDGLFQSITARTAGFNSIPIAALPVASLAMLSAWMFVGGSPGSCAGGVKTTSLAIWFAEVRSGILGWGEPRLMGRAIAPDVIQRSMRVFMLAMAWNLTGVLLLSATEAVSPGVNLEHVVFEQISAFGTVGLSADLTPKLTSVGRLWIIATMFVGRLGPLTLATWVAAGHRPAVRHPEGRLMIG